MAEDQVRVWCEHCEKVHGFGWTFRDPQIEFVVCPKTFKVIEKDPNTLVDGTNITRGGTVISVLDEDFEVETEESRGTRGNLRRNNQRRLRSQTAKRKPSLEEPIDPSGQGNGKAADSGPSSRRSLRQSTVNMPAGVYANPWSDSDAWSDSDDSSNSDEPSEPEDSADSDDTPGLGNTSSSDNEEPPTKRRRIALTNKSQAPQQNEKGSKVIIDLESEDESPTSKKDEGPKRKREDNFPSGSSSFIPLFPSLLEELGVECIDVLVGESQIRFPVHKKLLTDNSSGATEYFSKNPTHTSIICPWLDPEHFSIIFNWLYKRPVPGLKNFDRTSARLETFKKIELCRCAEKLGMPGLVNMLISYLGFALSCSRFWPSVEQIRDVYTNTHASNGLRLYMRHSYQYLLTQDTVSDGDNGEALTPTTEELESLMDCKEFRSDVFAMLKGAHKNGPPTNPKEELVCIYHLHDEKIPADTCVFKGLRFGIWDGSTMPS